MIRRIIIYIDFGNIAHYGKIILTQKILRYKKNDLLHFMRRFKKEIY